jgi:hypothetical protein
MNLLSIKSLLLFTILITFACGCKKDNNTPPSNQYSATETLFEPNSSNLLGIKSDETSGYKIYYYGSWNPDNTIEKYSSIVFEKIGNDTTFVFKLNSTGDSVSYAYFNIANQQNNTLLTFDIINGTDVMVNAFNYDWTNQTGSFIHQFYVSEGMVKRNLGNSLPSLGLKNSNFTKAVEDVIFAAAAVTVVVGTTALIVSSCPPCAVAIGVGGVIGFFASNANAATATTPPQVNNPNPTQQSNANPPSTPCNGFTATENITSYSTNPCQIQLTLTPSGGTAPYSFQWANTNSDTLNSYILPCGGDVRCKVTDARGCVFIW